MRVRAERDESEVSEMRVRKERYESKRELTVREMQKMREMRVIGMRERK